LVNSGFGGIQQYLQKNNPNYTAGQSTLDTLLLQGTPKALESIQSGGKALTGLEDPFNASVAQNDAFAQSAAQKTAQESQDVTSALQGVGTNLTNNLNTKTQGDVQKLTSLQSKLADDMSKNDAIALKNDLEASGVPKDVLQTLLERLSAEGTYKVPLSQNGELVKGSPTDFNLANEASPEDYANSAAWASLTGQQMPLDQANAAQAGKAPAVSPDVTSFLNNAQGIIGEKDRGLLQAPSNALSNAAQLVGAQDIIANPGDGPSGQSIANAFIQAIQRNGPENAPAANAAYDQALKQFALLGGRQTDTAVSGLYQFLTRMAPILGRNDFGQPADGLTPPSDPTSPGIIAPFTGEGQTPKLYSGNV
jgi:hypothetical protein